MTQLRAEFERDSQAGDGEVAFVAMYMRKYRGLSDSERNHWTAMAINT